MTTIIGINGFKRSGKGETAAAVERLLPNANVKQVGFADKLKIIGAKALGFVDLSDQECVDLMDRAKELWLFQITEPAIRRHDIEPYSPFVDQRYPVTTLTGRQYLQHLGNQARQVFGENFWIDQVLPQPSAYDPGGLHQTDNQSALRAKYPGVECLVITDVRYENEAQRIKTLGGIVWEVRRPGTASDGHDSEQTLPRDLIDWQIHNDGDLGRLEILVDEAILKTLS